MTKVYGTGTYDFRRHRVAEYPVEAVAQLPEKMLPSMTEKPPESKPGLNVPSSITLAEIQRDRLTKIAASNWAKADEKKPFSPDLVKEIYDTELTVKGLNDFEILTTSLDFNSTEKRSTVIQKNMAQHSVLYYGKAQKIIKLVIQEKRSIATQQIMAQRSVLYYGKARKNYGLMAQRLWSHDPKTD
ncbi:hypothetical protein RND71_001639 [Anisodus tanguticus]|uniref:Uncharacterized protein n=1 Tax=Anisodus tanguticus TaxID=243964 RepID=A0AAE1VSF2_9SOLA|nr:hypothetical protein RND71_001639 [Anisodus tanguticus]